VIEERLDSLCAEFPGAAKCWPTNQGNQEAVESIGLRNLRGATDLAATMVASKQRLLLARNT
jgi:hypothetical protein